MHLEHTTGQSPKHARLQASTPACKDAAQTAPQPRRCGTRARRLTAALCWLPALLAAGMPAAQASSPGTAIPATAVPDAAQPATEGEIRKVDAAGGKLTVRHGPIPHLDMAPMTMNFRVANPDLLTQVKAGDRVRFQVARIDGVLTITRLAPLP